MTTGMRRRDFIGRTAIGAAALLTPTWLARAAQDGKKPNIIVIMTDDMGFSDLGCYGSEIKTPVLDSLAAGGVRFTQFYNTARCCPTRASLLTGLHPHQAGIGHMTEDKGIDGYRGDLNRSCVTIAEAVKPAGYATFAVGKWHVTKETGTHGAKGNWPLQRGFERYYGTIAGAGSYYDPGTLVRDNTMISPFDDAEYKPEKYYYTDAIGDHAARFVKEHAEKKKEAPFFMYVAFTAAHWPLHAPEEEIAKYKGMYDAGYGAVRQNRFERQKKMGLINPAWELSKQAGDWEKEADKAWEARCMETYAAQIDRMDQNVGRIVAALKSAGQFENTVIMFLQDNGGCAESMGREKSPGVRSQSFPPIASNEVLTVTRPERTRGGAPVRRGIGVMPGPADTYISYGEGWANVSDTPFRYYKHYIHEGGISTPLIVHWPSGITRRGVFEAQPGQLPDIMSTCVELSGASYPKEKGGTAITPMEGRSLVPAFGGKPVERDGLYWEHEGNRAVRIGKWKLVARGPQGAWELYDMEADRTEMHNLAETQSERVKQMAAQWESWAKRTGALPWPWATTAEKKGDAGPSALLFELKNGDALDRDCAPGIAGKSIAITAAISNATDGVIVSQGGEQQGYSVYIKNGAANFSVVRGKKRTVVTTPAAVGKGAVTIGALLAKDGAMTLKIDGKDVASGKAAGVIEKMPVAGLQIGRDNGYPTGDYEMPSVQTGTIASVRIELGK